MIAQLRYWLDVVATACGLDTAGELSLAGVLGATLAVVTLIHATFKAVTATFWPGETDPDHVKNRMLRYEVEGDAD